MKTIPLVIVALCLLLSQPRAARAQTNSPAPLPAAAQDAVNKGIIAAKVPDYLLAIRFFEEARKIAPQAPVVYLNLGLAESRMPGRELRAIAWFSAYLAAYANATNAAAVKDQIAVLDVRDQSNISRFLKSVRDAASQLSGDDKDLALVYVAGLLAEAGDQAEAFQTIELMQDRKGQAQQFITEGQAKTGNIPGAKRTADLIRDWTYKSRAQRSIAEAQLNAGDTAGAKETLASALFAAERIGNASSTDSEQNYIAQTQIEAGDIAGARKTATLTQGTLYKVWAYSRIAKAQAISGDTASAQMTLASAQQAVDVERDVSVKSEAESEIKQAKNMVKLIASMPNANWSRRETRPPGKVVIKVSDWLERLDDDERNGSNDGALNTGPFLDLASYLKALPPAKYPQHVFDDLRKTATKIVKAQNVIGGMLKRQE